MLSRVGFFKGHQAKSLVSLTARTTSTTPPVNEISKCDDSAPPADVNFRPVRQEPGKVRLGFLPEEWFTFFYKKTGVTGPYAFGIGLSTYLMSKEFYVMEHEFYNGLSIMLFCIIATKKLGPTIAKYLDKEIDDYEASMNANRKAEKEMLNDQIQSEERNQWSSEGQLMLVKAKRENVALQLEAAYRQRLMQAYGDIKQRLDYQMERQSAERRIAQKHLVSWVVKNVLSSITSEQEKQNIDKCIADLAVLSKA